MHHKIIFRGDLLKAPVEMQLLDKIEFYKQTLATQLTYQDLLFVKQEIKELSEEVSLQKKSLLRTVAKKIHKLDTEENK